MFPVKFNARIPALPILLATLMLTAGGCGFRGPLYLPDESPQQAESQSEAPAEGVGETQGLDQEAADDEESQEEDI
jgi:predicted small lipoprotein YifL